MSYFVLSQLSRKQTFKWKRSWKVLRRYIPLRSSIVQAESAEEGMRNWTFWPSLERGQVPPSSFHWARNRQKSLHYYVNNKTWANVDEQILWCKDFSSLLRTRMFLKRGGALFLLLHKRCLFRQECLEPFNRYAQNQAWNGKWKVTSLWSAIRKTPPKKLDLIRAGFSIFAIFPKIYV